MKFYKFYFSLSCTLYLAPPLPALPCPLPCKTDGQKDRRFFYVNFSNPVFRFPFSKSRFSNPVFRIRLSGPNPVFSESRFDRIVFSEYRFFRISFVRIPFSESPFSESRFPPGPNPVFFNRVLPNSVFRFCHRKCRG